MRIRSAHVLEPLAWGLGLTLTLLWLMNGKMADVARAQVSDGYNTYYVAASCTGVPDPCFTSVQDAVDAVDDPDDIVKVAAGTYTGVLARPVPSGYPNPPASGVVTQVVYVTKSLAIQGGYTSTNDFNGPPDPEANHTILDAEGQGRALLIAGDITTTIQGLHITGGAAQGLGGSRSCTLDNCLAAGAGVYVFSGTVDISDNKVYGNAGAHDGGGIHLDSSTGVLGHNTITNNLAYMGGGVASYQGSVTFYGNTVFSNTAGDSGGGMYLNGSDATVMSNTISYNTADWYGGGLGTSIYGGNVLLSVNLVLRNVSSIFGQL